MFTVKVNITAVILLLPLLQEPNNSKSFALFVVLDDRVAQKQQ